MNSRSTNVERFDLDKISYAFLMIVAPILVPIFVAFVYASPLLIINGIVYYKRNTIKNWKAIMIGVAVLYAIVALLILASDKGVLQDITSWIKNKYNKSKSQETRIEEYRKKEIERRTNVQADCLKYNNDYAQLVASYSKFLPLDQAVAQAEENGLDSKEVFVETARNMNADIEEYNSVKMQLHKFLFPDEKINYYNFLRTEKVIHDRNRENSYLPEEILNKIDEELSGMYTCRIIRPTVPQ